MAVDVGGYLHLAKAAIPEPEKVRDPIVTTSSVFWLRGDREMVAYNTSKGAVTIIVRAMPLDADKHDVRVDVVDSSFTGGGRTEDMQADPALVARFEEHMPLGPLASNDRPSQ